MSVNVVINFQALPEKASELLPLLKEARDISRATGHLLRILPLVVGPPDNGVIQAID